MSTPEPSCLPAVEDILEEMIERRPTLEPIAESAYDRIVAATPRWKLKRLEQRFYTPAEHLGLGKRRQRLWRLKPGLYENVFFDPVFAEVVLREAGTSVCMRVQLPQRMEWPLEATHLKMNKPGEDPSYPRGKAEWVCL